ncbi:MAG: hypothetical protein V2A34_13150, partial [Lentisphaerota bacterium]
TQQIDESWGSGLFYDPSTSKWRVYTGSGPYPEANAADPRYLVLPDDGLIIQSKHAGDWTWTLNMPYDTPTRYMDP